MPRKLNVGGVTQIHWLLNLPTAVQSQPVHLAKMPLTDNARTTETILLVVQMKLMFLVQVHVNPHVVSRIHNAMLLVSLVDANVWLGIFA